MSVVGTAHTTLPDPRKAALQLVDRARAGLEGKPTFAILLATVNYDLEALNRVVQESLGDVPIWGGTSANGVFTGGGWFEAETGAASLMLLAKRPAGAGVAPIGSDPVEAGRAAAAAAVAQLGEPPHAFLTLPQPGQEAGMLLGIDKVAPGVPVVGGASGEHIAGGMRQFANGHVYQNAFSVAAIGGKEVGFAFLHGYKPTGKKAVMTAVSDHRLLTLDGRPALDVYAEWTGFAKGDVVGGALITASTRFPLVIHMEGTTLSVHPTFGHADGGIDTGVALPQGMTMELMENSVDGMLEEVEHVVGLAARYIKKPTAVVLSHCAGRAMALGDRIGEVPAFVHNAVGDVPLIGFLAFGEQGCLVPNKNAHGNLSLAALVLGVP